MTLGAAYSDVRCVLAGISTYTADEESSEVLGTGSQPVEVYLALGPFSSLSSRGT